MYISYVRLATHLARAAYDICAALAYPLAALETDEALDKAQEAILSCASTTQTVSLLAFDLLTSRS